MNSEDAFIKAMFPFKVEVWFSDESKCIIRKEHCMYEVAKQKCIEYSEISPFVVKLINYTEAQTEIYKGGNLCEVIKH